MTRKVTEPALPILPERKYIILSTFRNIDVKSLMAESIKLHNKKLFKFYLFDEFALIVTRNYCRDQFFPLPSAKYGKL